MTGKTPLVLLKLQYFVLPFISFIRLTSSFVLKWWRMEPVEETEIIKQESEVSCAAQMLLISFCCSFIWDAAEKKGGLCGTANYQGSSEQPIISEMNPPPLLSASAQKWACSSSGLCRAGSDMDVFLGPAQLDCCHKRLLGDHLNMTPTCSVAPRLMGSSACLKRALLSFRMLPGAFYQQGPRLFRLLPEPRELFQVVVFKSVAEEI